MLHETIEFKEWQSIFWKPKSYDHNQICYSSIKPEDNKILLVNRGTLLIQISNQQGEKINTEILVEGDIINVEALLESPLTWEIPNFIQYQVTALGSVEIYEIEKEFLLSHLYVDPRKYHRLFEKIIIQLVNISFSNVISNKKSQTKIAWALYRIVTKVGQVAEKDTNLITLPRFVTQAFLAQISNTGKARTNEVIKDQG
ncbi:Crp/Fnr family transcriptional regulator [Listeria valentina]|uniref:Crp/Fnr family transcriptional regulator n=1 Tax=Listeria valentina TaxID=2705293 RepID=UPI00142F5A8B|nr:Crp/Fnr family transcriptional regulator [Listeria valentina]